MSDNPQFYDVAIIGGGVSGIYTGWRLLTCPLGDGLAAKWQAKDGALKVAVFEGSNRIGGRLLSAIPPGAPHVKVEIGGMRYVSSQTLVRSLVENKLKLPHHGMTVDVPTNIAYLRGQHMRMEDLTDASMLPYNLTWSEISWMNSPTPPTPPNPPSALISWAMTKLLPLISTLHGDELYEYLKHAVIDGVPLYKHGFWNLLAKSMSFEAYEVSIKTVGYDSLGMNANAVDTAMEYFDFAPDVTYSLLSEGYDSVPWTLQEQFTAAGGSLFMNSWLKSFDSITLPDGTTGVQLEFADGRPTITARSIVLAMPRRSLQLLAQVGPVMDPVKSPRMRKLMDSVEPVGLYKMLLAYPYPWWESAGVTAGRSLTDLPVRQCYYWAVEGQQKGANPNNTNSLAMAYNDMLSADFWGGLRTRPLGPDDSVTAEAHVFRRRAVPFLEDDPEGDDNTKRMRANWDAHRAPKAMVTEMHRQLKEFHNNDCAPEPYDAAMMDWNDDPYGGAVHFWNPGHKSWEVLQEMTQPVHDFPCYVCGEAYSTSQTWVEGALQTAEIVLQSRMGVPPPDWITENAK